ncbi:MAG: 4-hydroxy-3-methylbut-2-enyl diphosphate reductase, partial [Synergistaceae bacterium]|nr:4-hydroxy-3-methylbut-2-enyl diphosphate reductase [Synergistaceae bacterium]
IMAEHAGFCFGVKRAVDAISESLKDNPEVWTIGLPIHNPQEVSRLEALGLRVAQNDSEIPEGAKVLIRAHGEPLDVISRLRNRGIDVEDMTCPFVKKAQEKASSLSQEGYYVVLLGDKNHPEIKGIMGHVDNPENAEVIADEKEASGVQFHAKTALISQTTQREERLEKAAAILVGKSSELRVCNTICKATAQRQEAVRNLVRQNNLDGVVLIGGKSSANTSKLRDILQAEGVDVLWVEDENETLENQHWFNGKIIVGIAAGASTPEWLIHKIKNIIAAKQDLQGVLIH